MVKKVVSILTGSFLLFSVTSSFAVESCIKCHKTEEKLVELLKKSNVKSAEELVDLLRHKSSKKNLHKAVTDEDIKKAFQMLTAQKTKDKKEESKEKAKPTEKTENKTENKTKPRKKIEGC